VRPHRATAVLCVPARSSSGARPLRDRDVLLHLARPAPGSSGPRVAVISPALR
jgi:hypothetical protein